MEVLIFQKEAFEEMAAKFSRFSDRVNELLAKKSLNKWMDNQEVCQQLNISPPHLTRLPQQRNNILLPVRRQDSLQGIGHRADACRKLPGGVQIAS